MLRAIQVGLDNWLEKIRMILKTPQTQVSQMPKMKTMRVYYALHNVTQKIHCVNHGQLPYGLVIGMALKEPRLSRGN